MFKIEEYTRLYKNHSMKAVFDRMEKMGLAVDRKVKKPELLDYGMKLNYREISEEYDKEFTILWQNKINANLLYKQPELVNYEFYNEEDHITSRKDLEITTSM
jgi:hypothetical protein